MINPVFGKVFWTTLLFTQNRYHRYGVLGHTLKVAYMALKHSQYRFIIPALLHDIGKPFCAYQDEEDQRDGTYSFTNHEELSWHIIRRCPLISQRTKELVRYHYLVRDIEVSTRKGKLARLRRIQRRWDSLSTQMQGELKLFLLLDDAGKK
ncbi:MAG: HD domain-containing protein [Sulfuricurvum sp.]